MRRSAVRKCPAWWVDGELDGASGGLAGQAIALYRPQPDVAAIGEPYMRIASLVHTAGCHDGGQRLPPGRPYLLAQGRAGLRVRRNQWVPDWAILRRVLNIGAPAGCEQLAMRSGQAFFSRVVSALGTVAYAAH